MIELLQRHGLLASFKEAHWRYGLTSGGEAEERRYLKIRAEFAAHLEGGVSPEPFTGAPRKRKSPPRTSSPSKRTSGTFSRSTPNGSSPASACTQHRTTRVSSTRSMMGA